MSRIIIYDNKNILIADLDRTETKRKKQDIEVANNKDKAPVSIFHNEYAAIFKKYKIIHSISLKKQLKKIEKIFKYHKEGGKNVKKNI